METAPETNGSDEPEPDATSGEPVSPPAKNWMKVRVKFVPLEPPAEASSSDVTPPEGDK